MAKSKKKNAITIVVLLLLVVAMGAAYLAGLAVGYWNSKEDVRKNWSIDRTFLPAIDPKVREEKLAGWNRAVQCSYGWARVE